LENQHKLLPPELHFLTPIWHQFFVDWRFAPNPTGGAYNASRYPLCPRKKKEKSARMAEALHKSAASSLTLLVALRLESMDNGCSVHGVDWLRQRYCHPHGHRCRRHQAQVDIDVSK